MSNVLYPLAVIKALKNPAFNSVAVDVRGRERGPARIVADQEFQAAVHGDSRDADAGGVPLPAVVRGAAGWEDSIRSGFATT
jgi:hypothetical protein